MRARASGSTPSTLGSTAWYPAERADLHPVRAAAAPITTGTSIAPPRLLRRRRHLATLGDVGVMPWQPWQKFVRSTSWHAATRRTHGVPCAPPDLRTAVMLLRSAGRRHCKRQRGSRRCCSCVHLRAGRSRCARVWSRRTPRLCVQLQSSGRGGWCSWCSARCAHECCRARWGSWSWSWFLVKI